MRHEKTYLPFAVGAGIDRGRGREFPHGKQTEEVLRPEFNLDFIFFGEDGGPRKTLAMLVVSGPRTCRWQRSFPTAQPVAS